jgi:hypothetical protein
MSLVEIGPRAGGNRTKFWSQWTHTKARKWSVVAGRVEQEVEEVSAKCWRLPPKIVPLGPGGSPARIDAVAVLRLAFIEGVRASTVPASSIQTDDDHNFGAATGFIKLTYVPGGCDAQN